MKKNMDISKFYHYSFPAQAILATCDDADGKTNPIAIAWHCPISKKPPLYGISVAPSRYSYGLIEKKKEFVINFLPFKLAEKVNFCGTKSGRNVDKVKEMGFTVGNSEKIKSRYIKESYVHMECKLYDSKVLGDHTFFVGEIVNILADEEAFTNDLLNNDSIKPLYYLGDHAYTTIADDKQRL